MVPSFLSFFSFLSLPASTIFFLFSFLCVRPPSSFFYFFIFFFFTDPSMHSSTLTGLEVTMSVTAGQIGDPGHGREVQAAGVGGAAVW
jgi:hypothetical protein